VSWISLGVVLGCAAAFLFGAILAYDPGRGFLARRNNPAG
jgi:ABC-2 type transport system permease protein